MKGKSTVLAFSGNGRSHCFRFIFPLGILFVFSIFSCEKEVDPVQQAKDISDYIRMLNYDPDAMLNVQDIPGGSLRTETANNSVSNFDSGTNSFIVCEEIDYSLQQNAEQVAIIRPTNGIIWPGALVKINEGLLDGLPEPVTLDAAPTTLRIDLPGMGSEGTIVVDNPTNSSTQAAINDALSWWNTHQYVEGYVNPSNSSYSVATSFSSQQLALDVGLNVEWASGSVSSHFNYTSSTTTKVAMMTFKQVFYTVTFDTPSQPSSVFDTSVSLDDVESTFNNLEPPGYVHSVSYGRIIMFRMTTTISATSTEVEGAMKYSAGLTSVSAEMEARYQSILENSSIEVITIGGNAEAASYAVTAQNFGDLQPILTGENAVYSISNPGVPIAYTVKFLKDNKIAKMGYTTDYTATECTVSHQGRYRVKCSGWYVARFSVTYKDYNGVSQSWGSGDITAGNHKICTVPGGSTEIVVHAWAVAGANIFTKYYNYPADHCFVVDGSLWFTGHDEVNCNFN